MEVKCNVCGTINDSNNKFCKGCFIPLHKTMQEWTKSIEDKVNEELDNIKNDETTLIEPVDINVWENIPLEDTPVKKLEDKIDKESSPSLVDDIIEPPIKDENANILAIEPVEDIKVEDNVNEELSKTIRINTPIDTKHIDDIKNALDNVSIVNSEEKDEREKSAFALAFKFNLILIVLTGIFTYFYGVQIDSNQDIIYGALATFLISGLATVLTFSKNYPSDQDTTQTFMIIFTTVILFELASRSIQLYYAGINYLYYYVFVYVIYILITILIMNTINKFIRNNKSNYSTSKFISGLNIFTLVLVFVFLGIGAWAKKTNYVVIEKKSLVEDETKVEYTLPDELKEYIDNINNTIMTNIQNDPNYDVPVLIDDVNFIENNLEIEAVNLAVDDYGIISSGEIKYNGIVYKYKY
ncbi:MAG: hypothetical protein J6G98_03175 [Bacilli bacterium]|nr:hypothetical protein [Bacilli bacterium]